MAFHALLYKDSEDFNCRGEPKGLNELVMSFCDFLFSASLVAVWNNKRARIYVSDYNTQNEINSSSQTHLKSDELRAQTG